MFNVILLLFIVLILIVAVVYILIKNKYQSGNQTRELARELTFELYLNEPYFNNLVKIR